MNIFKRITTILLTASLPCSLAFAQGVTWYGFDQDFINAKYTNSAIGELSFSKSHPAGTVHQSSCGGKDAELHIGMTLAEVQLPDGQMPLTDSPSSDDEDWGLVAELPNANSGNGKSKLSQLAGKPVTFLDISECGMKGTVTDRSSRVTHTIYLRSIPRGGSWVRA